MEDAKILVIDDEKNILESVKMVLTYENYPVETTNNGLDGIDLFKTLKPDIVILDVKMPGFNGIEILQRIRSLPKGHHLRIIICSGWDSEALKEQAIYEGANDYVIKPIGFNELEALVA